MAHPLTPPPLLHCHILPVSLRARVQGRLHPHAIPTLYRSPSPETHRLPLRLTELPPSYIPHNQAPQPASVSKIPSHHSNFLGLHSCSLDVPVTNTFWNCSLKPPDALLLWIKKKKNPQKRKRSLLSCLKNMMRASGKGRMTRSLPNSCLIQMPTHWSYTIPQYSSPFTSSLLDPQIHTLSRCTNALSFLMESSF